MGLTRADPLNWKLNYSYHVSEEIIQSEILDETDVITDNRRRTRRKDAQMRHGDLSLFTQESSSASISPQMLLATFQFLTTTFKEFKSAMLAESVLQKLIKQNCYQEKPSDFYKEEHRYLYQKGKASDCFVLILEGHMLMSQVSTSNFDLEAGPFFYFGREVIDKMSELAPQMSTSPKPESSDDIGKFVPDFNVKITDEVTYLKINAATYLKAYRATLIERGGAFCISSPDDAGSRPRTPKNRRQASCDTMSKTAADHASNSPLIPVMRTGTYGGFSDSEKSNRRHSALEQKILPMKHPQLKEVPSNEINCSSPELNDTGKWNNGRMFAAGAESNSSMETPNIEVKYGTPNIEVKHGTLNAEVKNGTVLNADTMAEVRDKLSSI